ncbi:MAG: GGDEF domain-containing protein, partial [Lysobacterales bacterium 14-68-21]
MPRHRFPRPLRIATVALAAMLWLWAAWAAAAITDVGHFLDQTESVRLSDHPRFVRMLAQIHRENPSMTSAQQWRLRYLDGWELAFRGDYVGAEAPLRDVIEHAGDAPLVARASALLMNNLSIGHRYEEAYALAGKLVVKLPELHDEGARVMVLQNLSQTLNAAGQTDLALRYARMVASESNSPGTLCLSHSLEAAALFAGKLLNPQSPELNLAIEACNHADQQVVAATAQLIKCSTYIDAKQPSRALELLQQIDPIIHRNRYSIQIPYLQVETAQALAQLGRDNEAIQAAKAALASGSSSGVSEVLRDAYHVLYEIEKKRGHGMAALRFYEHYVTQNTGYLNDVSARALAYQRVQQNLLAQKMQNEALVRQNQ